MSTKKEQATRDMHEALDCADIKTAKEAIEAGADVNTLHYASKLSPLHYAVRYKDPEFMNLLFANGMKVDIPGDKGRTALHMAASYGYVPCIRILLEHGADRTAVDADGLTASKLAEKEIHGNLAQQIDKWVPKKEPAAGTAAARVADTKQSDGPSRA